VLYPCWGPLQGTLYSSIGHSCQICFLKSYQISPNTLVRLLNLTSGKASNIRMFFWWSQAGKEINDLSSEKCRSKRGRSKASLCNNVVDKGFASTDHHIDQNKCPTRPKRLVCRCKEVQFHQYSNRNFFTAFRSLQFVFVIF